MRIAERLQKIGRAVQHASAKVGTWLKGLWHSRRARRIAGHTLLFILALVASPYLLACWRIALYGDQANQGALLVLIIVIIYGKDLCHEWLESKHARKTTTTRTDRVPNANNVNTRRRKRNKALRGRSH